MYKNKNIYLDSFEKLDELEQLSLTKYCEWGNCQEKGNYKAPTSREKLRVFKFFCQKHIKEYNKAWDYFKGRTSDEIYNEVSNDVYWHRKTNTKLHNHKIEDPLNLFENNSYKNNIITDKPISNEIKESLEVMNIERLSNISELKKQYKKMVKRYHPDLNKSGSNEKVVVLNEAYSSLQKFLKK